MATDIALICTSVNQNILEISIFFVFGAGPAATPLNLSRTRQNVLSAVPGRAKTKITKTTPYKDTADPGALGITAHFL
jgi:hypothetical protein